MLMAGLLWILGQFGVAPGPEALQQMKTDFQERGHHIGIDFGSTRGDLEKNFTVGLQYEYYAAPSVSRGVIRDSRTAPQQQDHRGQP